MTALTVWAFAWILIHWLISGGPLRRPVIAFTGETSFQIFFSALSAACLIGLCIAYAEAKPADRPLTNIATTIFVVFQFLAAILIVCGLSTRNPTAVRGEGLVSNPDVVHGILRVTRHPFLWGVLLWAVSYVLIRRDMAAMVFGGSIGFVAARGMWSIERKRRKGVWDTTSARRLMLYDEWWSFNHATSCVPMWAVLTGRQRLVLREIGFGRLCAAIGIWLSFLWVQLDLNSVLSRSNDGS